jgi:HEAT repeat protein
MDEIEAERYELPVKVEEREEERWRQVIRRGRGRLGLKGAPGSGKTFTTRQTVVALAREAAAQLERQQAGVEEVEIPVWVTAKNLAQTGAREIEDALLEALENGLQLKLPPNLRAWLKREIVSARAFIVVDALDELLESDRAPFEAKAKELDGLNARVITTCRTMQWEERKGWLGWGSLTEIELAPFKRRQQREFTGRFFEHQSDLGQNMERLLQVNYALRHACTTPLLLTFACLLHEEGKVNESTSYAALYAQMGRLMFSGRWRGVKPAWGSTRVREESCWRFLEGIAWRLFSKAPHLNRFTLDDWRRASRQATEIGAVAPMDASVFLEELERIGMIVPAGFDEQRADLCWSFAHRTFLEFLAARSLSRIEQKEWLAEAKRHFWFEPEWLEVLTFLAGLVDDATPLIEAVEDEQKNDDLFRSMLYLKVRLVGAAKKVDKEVTQRVCDEIGLFWGDTLDGWRDCLREFALPMIVRLSMVAPVIDIVVYKLEGWARHGNAITRPAAVHALSQIRTYEVGKKLLELTRHSDANVRQAAVETLGSGEVETAEERLLELTRDSNVNIRRASAYALGRVGTESAVERLLEMIHDWDPDVRDVAAVSLSLIGAEWVEKLLVELTWDESDEMRADAVDALARVGAEGIEERLLKLTQDRNAGVRQAAVRALGLLASDGVQERLLELTQDPVSDVRGAAVFALSLVGSKGIEEKLLEMTRSIDMSVRHGAAYALSWVAESLEDGRLVELTRDRDAVIRYGAVAALGWVRTKQAKDRLLELTCDEDNSVRQVAILGLDWAIPNEAEGQLLKLIMESDPVVRSSAARVLWRIAWKHKKPIRI